jgi:alpha-beta hydrolase superfamily lysophospholipase
MIKNPHLAVSLPLLLAIVGCAVPTPTSVQPQPQEPRLKQSVARMSDGYRLPMRRWDGEPNPAIVVLALHGFNDYSRAFEPLGKALAAAGVTTYAVDQRGFGATEQAGRWHGSDQLHADLRDLLELLRERHPQARLVVIGESMGAAVALGAAMHAPLDTDGLVLVAPAVWSRDTMPWYQRLALSIAARTLPALELTGEGLEIYPSDNEPMLIGMSKDPLVIKATRVDALWGVTNVMDEAASWPRTLGMRAHPRTLILYGERDEIIPPRAFCHFIAQVPLSPNTRFVLYEDGWHMLPRDLQGGLVRDDIVTWLLDPKASLPSGEEVKQGDPRLRRFCSPFSPKRTRARQTSGPATVDQRRMQDRS